jgi:hypothetical protein
MSIVTLKRKSKALHSTGINFNTVSKPGVGFSLNGVSRPVGAVGPTNLGRSVTRTPFRGTEPIGWGGGSRCRVPNSNRSRATACGTGHLKPNGEVDGYPLIVSNSGSCCIPQYLMKRSVKNTKGMLSSRYTGIFFGAYPRSWVQDVSNPLNNTSSQYTAALAQQPFSRACTGEAPTWTGSTFDATGAGSKEAFGSCGRNPSDPPISRCEGKRLPYAKNLNLYARDYPSYLLKIKAQCLNPLCSQQPFPYRVTNGSCTSVFTTWQQAQAAGWPGGCWRATNDTLRTAVKLWGTDKAQALWKYGDINKWDVSGVTDMRYLFCSAAAAASVGGDAVQVAYTARPTCWKGNCSSSQYAAWTTPFNDDISDWDVSSVTNFFAMFFECTQYNHNLSKWDVSNGIDFRFMFVQAISFQQQLCWTITTTASTEGATEEADNYLFDMFRNSPGCINTTCGSIGPGVTLPAVGMAEIVC